MLGTEIMHLIVIVDISLIYLVDGIALVSVEKSEG